MNSTFKFPFVLNDPKLIEKLKKEIDLILYPIGTTKYNYISDVQTINSDFTFLNYIIELKELDTLRKALDFTQYRLLKSLIQLRLCEIMELTNHSMFAFNTEEYIMGSFAYVPTVGFVELYKHLSTAFQYIKIVNDVLKEHHYPTISISVAFFYSDERKRTYHDMKQDYYENISIITHEDELKLIHELPSTDCIMVDGETIRQLYGNLVPGVFTKLDKYDFYFISPDNGLF